MEIPRRAKPARPLIPPVSAVACGILLTRWVDFTLFELLAAIGGFVLLTVAAARWASNRTARASCLLGFVAAGSLLVTAHRPDSEPAAEIDPYETVLLRGCVVEPAQVAPENVRFTVEVADGVRVRVSLYRKPDIAPPAIRYGDELEFAARVRVPRNFRNPGSFDYAGYLQRRSVFWTASAAVDTPLERWPDRCGTAAMAVIHSWRSSLDRRIGEAFPQDTFAAGMARALLLGDSTGIEEVWKEAFRRTGTYHALVVSGMHLTILSGFLLLFLRLVYLPDPLAYLLTGLAGWSYAVLTGFAMPVVRAATGLTLYLIGRHEFRRTEPLNLLAGIALLVFLADPGALWDGSFQLSFLAVAAIAAFAVPIATETTSPLRKSLSRLDDPSADLKLPPKVAQARIELRFFVETVHLVLRLPRKLVMGGIRTSSQVLLYWTELLLVSLAVQIGLAVPMIVYFHRFSVSGLIANLLLVPVLNLALPVTTFAILAGAPGASDLAASLLDGARAVVAFHAAWEPDWRIPDPPIWVAVLVAASLIGVAAAWRRAVWIRLVAAGVLTAGLALLCVHPFPARIPAGRLSLTAIDVGQGDGLLVTFPDGRLMLMDAGGFPPIGGRAPGIDTGEDVIAPYLWSRSIRKIDILAMSHAQADHIGGFPSLIRIFRPTELWIGGTPDVEPWQLLYETASRYNVQVMAMFSGAQFEYGGVRVRVLSPFDGDPPARNPNNDSLTLELIYGHRSFLLTGDIERKAEELLLERGVLRQVDVLKVGHHGSRTSTTEAFLEAVNPIYGIVSAGYANRFRHPHPTVVERFDSKGIPLLRTDVHGLVTISTDGDRLFIETDAWEPPYPSLGPIF